MTKEQIANECAEKVYVSANGGNLDDVKEEILSALTRYEKECSSLVWFSRFHEAQNKLAIAVDGLELVECVWRQTKTMDASTMSIVEERLRQINGETK